MRIRKIIFSIILLNFIAAQTCLAFQEPRTQELIEKITRKNLGNRVEIKKAEIEKKVLSKEELKQKEIEELLAGKGTWVNLWNYPKNINKFISRLQKFNIDTVYLQVNRSNTPSFKHKAEVDKLLKAAHQNDIKIIGWSYCYLKNVGEDAKKFIEVANYVSPDGESFDGMAADIEENTSLWAVRTYTNKIKNKIPDNYPLIAIVYSPKIKQDYPWEYVANNWDVLMPMTYWHGLKNRNHKTVYNFVKESITDLRKLSKKDDLNIHLITDGDRTHHNEVAISIQAAKDHGVNSGISIYPEHLASDEMLRKLGSFD